MQRSCAEGPFLRKQVQLLLLAVEFGGQRPVPTICPMVTKAFV